MSNSKRQPSSAVHVKSLFGPLEIQLLDHQLRTIATGYGELRTKVEAGLYMLQYRAGVAQEQEYIKVAPGQTFEKLDLSLKFPSAAPVLGGSSTHESHAEPARDISRLPPTNTYGDGGRLMIFARRIDTGQSVVSLNGLSLWDADMRLVSDLSQGMLHDDQNGWTAFYAQVNPGGYALRWSTTSVSRRPQPNSEPQVIDQSLWVAQGWITIVFIGYDSRYQELNRQGASIHLAKIGAGFEPYDEPQINQALELSLNGLRTGRSVVPDDLLDLLLNEKFQNPMLGIIGAHALLQRRQPKWALFRTVVRNLERLVPGHPDVIALKLIGKLEQKDDSRTKVPPVDWPPMLAAGYRGLIARDWHEQNRIPPGSVAERAAAQMLTQAPWSCWLSLDGATSKSLTEPVERGSNPQVAAVLEQTADPNSELGAALRRLVTPSEAIITPNAALESAVLGDEPSPSVDLTDPAVQQVSRYLAMVNQFADTNTLSEMSLRQFSQLGLPVASVERAIQILLGATK